MKHKVKIYHTWRTNLMNSREIDYIQLLKNIKEMILLLEFDSMRSAGKAKLNSQHLHSLYFLKEKYEEMIKNKKPKKEDK